MDEPVFEARHGPCLSTAGPWQLSLMYLLVPSTHGTVVDRRRVLVFGSEPIHAAIPIIQLTRLPAAPPLALE